MILKDMKKINEAQEKAIQHFQGPMLVLAGPGSGKTFVITQRTQYLIEHHGVDPGKILVITFTKAAAEEMKERFLRLMEGGSSGVNFGTFHGVFFKILKFAYHFTGNSIVREEDRYGYFRNIIGQLQMEIEDEKDFIEGVSGEISRVKCERMDLDHYYSMNCSQENFRKIYQGYDHFLRQSNKIDFDDMLVMCYELLTARADILKMWQSQYQYIMVDEAQDSNSLQYQIICLLASNHKNIVFVGDDDQSLYSFRGARPEIMLQFGQDFPGGKKILLEHNYRSQERIIQGALRVIQNNTKRYDKKIKAVRKPKDPIEIRVFPTLRQQNQFVLEQARLYHEKGISLSEIGVLFRTNSQPRALVELFMEYNIPFKMKDALPNIYEHWIAKNLITYIKIALGSRERGEFLQIINRPKRYISRDCFSEPYVDFNDMKGYFADKRYVIERIEKLEYDLELLKGMNPWAGIHYICKGIGFEDFLKEYASYRKIKEEELFDILDELKESARDCTTYEEWFFHIDQYGKELKEQAERGRQKEEAAIALATFHSSKGLEYDVVFIVDANEGITPHRKALTDQDMEEERRMFYVAMTRAKNNLHIYSVKERYNKELSCSRFIGEILFQRGDLVEGTLVKHKIYGKGKVIKQSEKTVVIEFEGSRHPKKLDIDFCIQNQLLTLIE